MVLPSIAAYEMIAGVLVPTISASIIANHQRREQQRNVDIQQQVQNNDNLPNIPDIIAQNGQGQNQGLTFSEESDENIGSEIGTDDFEQELEENVMRPQSWQLPPEMGVPYDIDEDQQELDELENQVRQRQNLDPLPDGGGGGGNGGGNYARDHPDNNRDKPSINIPYISVPSGKKEESKSQPNPEPLPVPKPDEPIQKPGAQVPKPEPKIRYKQQKDVFDVNHIMASTVAHKHHNKIQGINTRVLT